MKKPQHPAMPATHPESRLPALRQALEGALEAVGTDPTLLSAEERLQLAAWAGRLAAAPAAPRTLVQPPRRVAPKFGSTPPQSVDLGPERSLKLGAQALSLGVAGMVEVDADADGVSVGTPFGGITVDAGGIAATAGDGVRVSAGKGGVSAEAGGGRVSVGPDGASVSMPGLGTVGVDRGGRVTYEPPAGGAEPGPPAPNPWPTLPIPFPQFQVKPFDIPLQVPRLVVERYDVPVQVPQGRVERLDVPVPVPQLQPERWPMPWPLPGFGAARPLPLPPPPEPDRSEPPRLDDALALAISVAVVQWQPTARFAGLRVESAFAIGQPGCFTGAPIAPLLRAQPAFANLAGDEAVFGAAVERAFAELFERWRDGVTVPNLPWYPLFQAMVPPYAPPWPNMPHPLATCFSAAAGALAPNVALRPLILGHLPAALAPAFEDRARMIDAEVGAWFAHFLASRLVINVLGEGPVAGTNPMAGTVGPVVGGRAASPGPCLS